MGNQQQTVTVNRLTPNQRSAIDAMVPPAWIASLTKTTVSFTRGPVGANSSIVLELDKLIAEGRSLDGTLHQRRGHPIQPMQSVLRKVKAALA